MLYHYNYMINQIIDKTRPMILRKLFLNYILLFVKLIKYIKTYVNGKKNWRFSMKNRYYSLVNAKKKFNPYMN